ncbi:glycosyltransferase family 4 protein [Flavobacterium rhizosphaerae]|uniref:Glycosyltransferase family 1 protein n=1 Tax=Flavobacterium rhizosphaerae TaxID=3163298 RepID=A0ABW8YX90_9FLAO
MPKYAQWLAEGMRNRGHDVQIMRPEPNVYKLPVPVSLKKWLGYIDQYIIFSKGLKKMVSKMSNDTLYVVTDHALGPYVPIIEKSKHIIHCHDFLAQRSALGLIAENPTSSTGKIYQKFIRKGYSKGNNFISISKKTEDDLLFFLKNDKPHFSAVVYNSLNQDIHPLDINQSRETITEQIGRDVSEGYILHVGGNQWYKNRPGVIKIYNSLRNKNIELPLVMIGPEPSVKIINEKDKSPYKNDIHILNNVSDNILKKAYSGASIFVFPSLAEGFGWPIIEAMASGCFVVTTNEAPMNEVAGEAALLIDKMPQTEQEKWADLSADKIISNLDKKEQYIKSGLENVKRFDSKKTLDKIEVIYKKIVEETL